MTYEWHIHRLTCVTTPTLNNVVIEANWSLFGLVEGKTDISATEFGIETLPEYDPVNPFVPYDQLTETQVIDWVKASLGADKITQLEAKIDKRIQAQMKPAASPPLPWNN